ncbi:MAG: hypothetical protein OEZ02_13330 [Anaerolineae bacterium]|nr:hypothetical protein [Anaerolineae bacterium]
MKKKIMTIGIALPVILAAVMAVAKLYDQPDWQEIHLAAPLQEAQPTLYPFDKIELYLVLINGVPYAFDTRDPHPNGCPIRWSQTNQRFEEPCLGSTYALDGSYLTGPSPRGMDQYPVRTEDGSVQIIADMLIPGAERQP